MDLSFIKSKNSLRQLEKKEKLKTIIKERITKIQNYQSLRSGFTIDQELILMICNCVENVVKKKYKIDKKEFVIEILNDLFNGLSQNEQDNIKNIIQFSFDNKLIESIPIIEKAKYIAWNWIKRKVG